MVWRGVWLALVAASLAASGCGRSPRERPGGAEAPLRVVVTISPLLEAARALAPEGSAVSVLTPPGVSHHNHEPSPSAVASLMDADVVVMVGMMLEPRVEAALKKHPRPWRRLVVFGEVVGPEAAAFGAVCEHEGHEHGHAHDHDHSMGDPHLWLDPTLMEKLVVAMRGAVEGALGSMGRLDDAERARLDAAEARLIEEARAVDEEYRAAIADVASRVIVTHHDAYSRIAARHGLEVAAVIRPIHSVEPTPGAVMEAVEAIRKRGAKVVFIEPQFSSGAATRIAELTGARILTLDPIGNGDWAEMMRANLAALVEGLGE